MSDYRRIYRDVDKAVERDDQTGMERTTWERPRVANGRVSPEQFGAVADGVTDDSVPIQRAIDYAARIRGTVTFPAPAYAIHPAQIIAADYRAAQRQGIIARSHVTLDVGRSRLVQLTNPDIATTNLLMLHRVEDVRIVGGTFVGDRETHPGDGSNSKCIMVSSSRDVTIDGARVIDSHGDGVSIAEVSRWFEENITVTAGSPVITVGTGGRNAYLLPQLVPGLVGVSDSFPAGASIVSVDGNLITMSHPSTTTGATSINFHLPDSQHITVKNCIGDNNRRNGLVIESGRGITVGNCEWTNTHGASPEAGIDIEPYFGFDFLQDVTVEGCHTAGNVMAGMYVQNLRNVRVRGNHVEDGIGLRGTANCLISSNVIHGGVTVTRAGAQITGNRLIDGGVAIYNQEWPISHRQPLDVEVVNNTLTSQSPDLARVAVQNINNDPAGLRDIIVRGNTIRVQTPDRMARAVVSTAQDPASETLEVADNTVAVTCGQWQRGQGLVVDLSVTSQPATIVGNRVRVAATGVLAGASVLAVQEGAVVGNNIITTTPAITPLTIGGVPQ